MAVVSTSPYFPSQLYGVPGLVYLHFLEEFRSDCLIYSPWLFANSFVPATYYIAYSDRTQTLHTLFLHQAQRLPCSQPHERRRLRSRLSPPRHLHRLWRERRVTSLPGYSSGEQPNLYQRL